MLKPPATTAQWLYGAVFGAAEQPVESTEKVAEAAEQPVESTEKVAEAVGDAVTGGAATQTPEEAKAAFAARSHIGQDEKETPGGKAWSLTRKDLMNEAPGGVAWTANPETPEAFQSPKPDPPTKKLPQKISTASSSGMHSVTEVLQTIGKVSLEATNAMKLCKYMRQNQLRVLICGSLVAELCCIVAAAADCLGGMPSVT